MPTSSAIHDLNPQTREELNKMQYDTVKRPYHYNQGNIECIDAIQSAIVDVDGYEGMLVGNAIKYLWRWKKKEKPIEDLKKAIWYINKLIDYTEKRRTQPV